MSGLTRADDDHPDDQCDDDENAHDHVHEHNIEYVCKGALPGKVGVTLGTDLIAVERLRSELQPVAAKTALRHRVGLGRHDFRWSLIQVRIQSHLTSATFLRSPNRRYSG